MTWEMAQNFSAFYCQFQPYIKHTCPVISFPNLQDGGSSQKPGYRLQSFHPPIYTSCLSYFQIPQTNAISKQPFLFIFSYTTTVPTKSHHIYWWCLCGYYTQHVSFPAWYSNTRWKSKLSVWAWNVTVFFHHTHSKIWTCTQGLYC